MQFILNFACVLNANIMKNFAAPLLSFCLCLGTISATAQAFHKGTYLISLSEGSTKSAIKTRNVNDGRGSTTIAGDRDPLTFEYGVTDKLGIGFNIGGDVFQVNPNSLYGFSTTTGKDITLISSEITIDFNYHFLSTKKADFSVFSSYGIASVSFEGDDAISPTDGSAQYKYAATGLIFRTGVKAKYYFYKRLGFMCMVSAYKTSPMKQNEETANSPIFFNTNTRMRGVAIEFGPCFRIR